MNKMWRRSNVEFQAPSWSNAATAVIIGREPTGKDFRRIRRDALSVHILDVPPAESNLEFLSPVFDCLRVLNVTDYRCGDVSAVERMPMLKELFLSIDIDRPIDLSRVPKLRMFAGEWKNASSVVECRFLEKLSLGSPSSHGLDDLISPITILNIHSASRLHDVPNFSHASVVRELAIHGARSLDLSNLARYSKLETLSLESCTAVTGVAVLLQLPNLQRVYLDKCPSLEGWELLEDLRANSIRIVDRNPFDATFRSAVAHRQTWSFPPGKKYLPADRVMTASPTEYLVHPAFSRPLAIPDDILDDLSAADLPEDWLSRTRAEVADAFRELLGRCFEWALSQGADSVEQEIAPYGESDVTVRQFDATVSLRFLDDVFTLGGIRVLKGSAPLLAIEDSVEDGIHVFATDVPTELV